MRSKYSFKKNFGLEVGPANGTRRSYYLAENSRKNLDFFEFFDAIYTDIGWNLERIIPESIIPIIHSERAEDNEYYIYDLDVGANLSDRNSIRQLFPKNTVADLAKKLDFEIPNYQFFNCDDSVEMERRTKKCNKLTFYHYGRIVFEANRDKKRKTWNPSYLFADSNTLAGMQSIIRHML